MVITLCGSTRFKKEIMDAARDLTLAGHIVLAPFVFHHIEDEELTTEDKIRLDNLHKEKINMSDASFVVNVDGYIGESTYGEIDWANRMKKEIYFLNDLPQPEGAQEEDNKPNPDVQPVVNSEEDEA